jgi:hypothetical protein
MFPSFSFKIDRCPYILAVVLSDTSMMQYPPSLQRQLHLSGQLTGSSMIAYAMCLYLALPKKSIGQGEMSLIGTEPMSRSPQLWIFRRRSHSLLQ